jgi:hypothetical protein
MKSKDAIKMFKQLNITPQQAQSLLNSKLTTSKRLIKYLKEEAEPKKEKKEKKKKQEKPAPAAQPVAR